MKTKMLISLFYLGFALTPKVNAQTYLINPDHSQVIFTIPYMTISEVQGQFSSFQGEIEFETKSQTLKRIKAIINLNSINTQDQKRDQHLKDIDFFFTKKHPQAFFQSSLIKKINNSEFTGFGEVEIKGIKKQIKIDIKYLGSKFDHANKESLFFKANTQINRKEFNILWNKSIGPTEFLIGNEVQISLVIQAQLIGKKTAYSTHLVPHTKALEEIAQKKRAETLKNTTATPIATTAPPLASEGNHYPLWINLVVGFIGFCLSILISFWIKIKLIQYFKVENYSEGSLFALFCDAIIVGVGFGYAYWYFIFLYPN